MVRKSEEITKYTGKCVLIQLAQIAARKNLFPIECYLS